MGSRLQSSKRPLAPPLNSFNKRPSVGFGICGGKLRVCRIVGRPDWIHWGCMISETEFTISSDFRLVGLGAQGLDARAPSTRREMRYTDEMIERVGEWHRYNRGEKQL